jgi:hypothetical protein
MLLVLLGAADGLIEREVNLVGFVHLPVGDLGHRGAEGLEVVGAGLIHEDVAVGQKEDAFLGLGLPQPPDDLERDEGLARAGSHDEQDAVVGPWRWPRWCG